MLLPPTSRLLLTPWFPTPGSCAPGVQVFVVGDVHGRAGAFEAMLVAIGAAPRRAEERVLVLLGDLVGFGPHSLPCLELAMESEEMARVDTVVMLPGDHEIMMAQAILEPEHMLESWMLAGGRAIVEELGVAHLTHDPTALAEGIGAYLPTGWAEEVMDARGWWSSQDLLCVHAGIHPQQDRRAFLGQPADNPMPHHWAWMREPFLSWTRGWDKQGRTIVAHGHTPTIDRWIASDADMALLAPLERRRVALDAGAARRAQIASLEMVGDRARLRCVQHGRAPGC